jgi:16S rRNA (cytidine1402-2'-O)-methyltransferase
MTNPESRKDPNGTINSRMAASLYVVSTPIGNLDDITLRALHTLKHAGLIAAEDTRRTAILLRHFGISTPTTSFHEHNERQKLPQVIRKLAEGIDVALVSDAGTPLVADPGQRLIAAAIEEGIRVVPIPGASAVLAALTVSGIPADDFIFAGFVPSRSNSRKQWLASLSREKRPIVFFETPHRIKKTLADVSTILVDRPIIVARELTKLHEQVLRGTTRRAEELNFPQKGEITIVLGSLRAAVERPEIIDDKDVGEYFYQVTKNNGLLRRAALTQTAHHFGLSTKQVYSTLERLKISCSS